LTQSSAGRDPKLPHATPYQGSIEHPDGPEAMKQHEPQRAPRDDEDRATERRFAELIRRFWNRPVPTEQGETR